MKYYDKNLKYAQITFGNNLSYFMESERITIGRNSAEGEVDVDVGPHAFVSRRHLEVIYSFSRLKLKCIGKNGIFINDFFKAHSNLPYELPSKCVLRFPSTNVQVTVKQLRGCNIESDDLQSDDGLTMKLEDDEDYLYAKISPSNRTLSKSSAFNLNSSLNGKNISSGISNNPNSMDDDDEEDEEIISLNNNTVNGMLVSNQINYLSNQNDIYQNSSSTLLSIRSNNNNSQDSHVNSTASSRLLTSSSINSSSNNTNNSNNVKIESFTPKNNTSMVISPNNHTALNQSSNFNNFNLVSNNNSNNHIKIEGLTEKTNVKKIYLSNNSYRSNGNNIIYPNNIQIVESSNRRGMQSNSIPLDRGTDTQKPPYSYAQLIVQAISTSRDRQLTLNGIYTYITKNYPYFKSHDKGWQNSVRHNLSLNRYFIKVPRSQDEPGKGSFWKIDAAYENKLYNQAFRKRRLRNHNQQSLQQHHNHGVMLTDITNAEVNHHNQHHHNNNSNSNSAGIGGIHRNPNASARNINKPFINRLYSVHKTTSNIHNLANSSNLLHDDYEDEHLSTPTYVVKVNGHNSNPSTINLHSGNNAINNNNVIYRSTNNQGKSVFHHGNHTNNATTTTYLSINGQLFPKSNTGGRLRVINISQINNTANNISSTSNRMIVPASSLINNHHRGSGGSGPLTATTANNVLTTCSTSRISNQLSLQQHNSTCSSTESSSVIFHPSSSDYSSPPLTPPTNQSATTIMRIVSNETNNCVVANPQHSITIATTTATPNGTAILLDDDDEDDDVDDIDNHHEHISHHHHHNRIHHRGHQEHDGDVNACVNNERQHDNDPDTVAVDNDADMQSTEFVDIEVDQFLNDPYPLCDDESNVASSTTIADTTSASVIIVTSSSSSNNRNCTDSSINIHCTDHSDDQNHNHRIQDVDDDDDEDDELLNSYQSHTNIWNER